VSGGRVFVRRHPRVTGVKENYAVLKAIQARRNFDKGRGKLDYMDIGGKAEWREFYGELGERAFEEWLRSRGLAYQRSPFLEERTGDEHYVVCGKRIAVTTSEPD